MAEDFGKLSGTVTDETGTPLPGVSVTVLGTALQGTKTTMTDETGQFRIAILPVGRDYQVIFSLSGFKKITKIGIVVELGKETHFRTAMPQSALAEQVTVVGTAPVIDPKSSTTQVNMTKQLIETLASDRNYQMVMAMMPGCQEGNNPQMLGGSMYSNIYMYDGLDTTDPQTKTWSTWMNYDNFEEMQVITSGMPAEYGRGTGAIVNLVTKSGSNQFHGILRVYMTKMDWNANIAPGKIASYDNTFSHYMNQTRPSANVGGPILKDKLWFFASWDRQKQWTLRSFYNTAEDYWNNTPEIKRSYFRGHSTTAKLTFRLNANNNIMVQFIDDPTGFSLRFGSNTLYEADSIRHQGGPNLMSDWTMTLGPNTYLTGRYAMKRMDLSFNPTSTVGGPTIYNGVYSGSARQQYDTDRYNDTVSLSLGHFARTGFGTHDLKIGAEGVFLRLMFQQNDYPGGEIINYTDDGTNIPLYKAVYRNLAPPAHQYHSFLSFYLQDKWEVMENLTLNLGLRMESQTYKNDAKQTVLKWGWGDMLAPRLGVVYGLKRDKFSASWSRIYETYMNYGNTSLISLFQPDIFSRTIDYYGGEGYGYPTWTYVYTDVTGSISTTTKDANLKPTYMNEWGVGYEHAFSQVVAASVNYIHRDWHNKIERYDYDQNNIYHFANAVYPEGWGNRFKKYDAVMFTLKKNLGQDKYQFLASYTHSFLKGFGLDEMESGSGIDQYSQYNWLGWLPGDIRHMFKFNGSFFLPADIVLGVGFFWNSGTPWNTQASVYIPETDRQFSYWLEPQGSRRYQAQWRLDLHLEKKFEFLKKLALSVYVDAFNILNQQNDNYMNTYFGTIVLDGNQPGANYTVLYKNAAYGRSMGSFPPASYFFGVKFEF